MPIPHFNRTLLAKMGMESSISAMDKARHPTKFKKGMETMTKKELEQEKQKQYDELVKQVTPQNSLLLQMCKAFLTGGIICTIGQGILEVAKSMGLDYPSGKNGNGIQHFRNG